MDISQYRQLHRLTVRSNSFARQLMREYGPAGSYMKVQTHRYKESRRPASLEECLFWELVDSHLLALCHGASEIERFRNQ